MKMDELLEERKNQIALAVIELASDGFMLDEVAELIIPEVKHESTVSFQFEHHLFAILQHGVVPDEKCQRVRNFGMDGRQWSVWLLERTGI